MKNVHNEDYASFVYFHESTKGESGRAVYINPELLSRFLDLIDTRQSSGQNTARLINAIKDIKVDANGLSTNSNLSNGFEARKDCGPVEVTYTVYQDNASSHRGPGAYITKLKRLHKDEQEEDKPAGLYKATLSNRRSWDLKKEEGCTIPTAIGSIGAIFNGERYDAKKNSQPIW